jgi:hypothetical protein
MTIRYLCAMRRAGLTTGDEGERGFGIAARVLSRGIDPDRDDRACRLMPWRSAALESLDDKHAAATAWISWLV